MNMCVSSANLTLLTETDKWRDYLQYGDVLIDEFGTNSVDYNVDLSVQITRHELLWNLAKSAGYTRIYKTELMCKTTSSDSWATNAQTVVIRWGAGELASQLNQAMQLRASQGVITGFVSTAAVKDPANPLIWKTDDVGTQRLTAFDGLHPSGNGNVVLAWDTREAVFIALEEKNLTQLAGWVLLLDASVLSSLLDSSGIAAGGVGFNGLIATWTSVIAGGNNAAQGDNTKRPSYTNIKIGNVTCPVFDGVNDNLGVAAIIQNSAGTVITVSRPFNTDQTRHIFANAGGSGWIHRGERGAIGCGHGLGLYTGAGR